MGFLDNIFKKSRYTKIGDGKKFLMDEKGMLVYNPTAPDYPHREIAKQFGSYGVFIRRGENKKRRNSDGDENV